MYSYTHTHNKNKTNKKQKEEKERKRKILFFLKEKKEEIKAYPGFWMKQWTEENEGDILTVYTVSNITTKKSKMSDCLKHVAGNVTCGVGPDNWVHAWRYWLTVKSELAWWNKQALL